MDGDDIKLRKPSKWPLITMIFGIIVLIAGVALITVKIITAPKMDDAEFLITAGEWVREDQPNVIWDFTKVGQGMLTTDKHLNDYDFIWSLEGGKLKVETSWLYDLNDEFTYSLDQNGKVLTIKNTDKNIEVKFKAQEKAEQ